MKYCFLNVAQAAAGNQGILGPTKIYLAMQPPTVSESATVKEESVSQVLIDFTNAASNVCRLFSR